MASNDHATYVDNLITAANRIVAAWLNDLNNFVWRGSRPTYGTTTGAANVYVLTLPVTSLYIAASEGDTFLFKAHQSNTGAVTFSVVGGSVVAAAALQRYGNALTGGEIQSGGVYSVTRVGSVWQMNDTGIQPIAAGGTGLVAVGTKGNLFTGTGTAYAELAVGSNTQIIVADSTQTSGIRWADPATRGMLAGCQLTWISGTSMTLGAGTCRDDADTETMKVASALTMSNLTVGWVVGNNQPKIRTGVVLANGMSLHVYVIKRVDTGVVDWFLTDEASSPTLPTNYTKSRRVASIRFVTGAQTILQVLQDGDLFQWNALAADISAGNPGVAAVTRTLTVPTGIRFEVILQIYIVNNGVGTGTYSYTSDLAVSDQAPTANLTDTPAALTVAGAVQTAAVVKRVMTNTSAQVRSRISFSDANVSYNANTIGYVDTRGRNA